MIGKTTKIRTPRHWASSGSRIPEISRLLILATEPPAARREPANIEQMSYKSSCRILFCFLIHSPLIERSEILFERVLLLVAICCRISKEFSKSNWATKGTSLHASSNCDMYLVFILRVGFVHVRHHGSSFSVGTCVRGSRSSSFLVSTAA